MKQKVKIAKKLCKQLLAKPETVNSTECALLFYQPKRHKKAKN